MSTAISIKNVSKKYVIGKQKDGSLRGTLAGLFAKQASTTEEFWALNDVSFDIQQGDVVGIIGKNGAGKSTLLKILSQITKPTTGSIELNGRVASLLEVGTGFHPELTGRENVYLNGTILGMTRKEVAAKFDEIVAFSGVEKFIDTPVKHYSSGMYVRLAFAVAAHLEPEILIIDEVLAVGDAEFQKKCLGKMGEVAGEGRTVIFVSHNLAAVSTLCNKGIVLKNGQVVFDGDTVDAISAYMSSKCGGVNYELYSDVGVANIFQLKAIRVKNEDLDKPVVSSLEIQVETEIELFSDEPHLYHLTYHVSNEMGETMFSTFSESFFQKGVNKASFIIPPKFFQSGTFSLTLFFVFNKKQLVKVERDVFTFTIVDGGEAELGEFMGREPGYIRPQFKWINHSNL